MGLPVDVLLLAAGWVAWGLTCFLLGYAAGRWAVPWFVDRWL